MFKKSKETESSRKYKYNTKLKFRIRGILTWSRDETICSLGSAIALASFGAGKRARKESVVEVESVTCNLFVFGGILMGQNILEGGGDGGGVGSGGLAVAEALRAINHLQPLATTLSLLRSLCEGVRFSVGWLAGTNYKVTLNPTWELQIPLYQRGYATWNIGWGWWAPTAFQFFSPIILGFWHCGMGWEGWNYFTFTFEFGLVLGNSSLL